jgi:Tfp pilus assembly protein PilZ
MSLSDSVEIIDISLGGVALKAARRLNIGKEYMLKLEEKGKKLDVRGTVVRSELVGIQTREDGEMISIYTAGMVFKEGTSEKLADFLKPIEHNKKEAAPDVVDQRQHVRFNITTSGEKVLSFPGQFKVRAISLVGMLIQTNNALDTENKIPMELALKDGDAVRFLGRVVSCKPTEGGDQTPYEIGVEFGDLTDKDKQLLKTFIDYLSTVEDGAGPA